ncbi:MAG: transposase [Rhodothermales bacterium]
MGKRRKYSASFKFKVVLEALQGERTNAEMARAYDVHPVTLSKWKKTFQEEGAKVFGGDDVVKEKDDKIAKLEQMLGKKEVELALLKNFFPED